ncbi:MAG: hypothetical protein QE265_12300 [Rhodoferax sp.]|nr:hypothetical protein [Rhodoferax sp.]
MASRLKALKKAPGVDSATVNLATDAARAVARAAGHVGAVGMGAGRHHHAG